MTPPGSKLEVAPSLKSPLCSDRPPFSFQCPWTGLGSRQPAQLARDRAPGCRAASKLSTGHYLLLSGPCSLGRAPQSFFWALGETSDSITKHYIASERHNLALLTH